MTTVPVVDVLLVALEFVALFLVTWIAWFCLVTLFQIWSTKTTRRPRQSGPVDIPERSGTDLAS